MEFWLFAIVIAGLVGATFVAVLRRPGRRDSNNQDLAFYKDQLSEIDRDLERGILTNEDADQLRVEISRRLLAADARQTGRANKEGLALFPAALIGLVTIGVAFALYLSIGFPDYPDLPLEQRLADADTRHQSRPSQVEIEAQIPPSPNFATPNQEQVDLVEQLRTILEDRPDDLEGHVILTQSLAGLGDFVAAHQTQQKVLEILGEQATGRDWANYADLMVLAAGGYVSPQAERALVRALELDPANGAARYYVGLMFWQIGRADRAFGFWRALLENSDPDAPWMPAVRAQIIDVAAEAGIRYTLPETTAGPSAADVAAAQDMSEEDRAAMIEGMVNNLSERLANQGGTPQEWAQLIRALAVLERHDQSRAIYDEALTTFANRGDALDMLRDLGDELGYGQ